MVAKAHEWVRNARHDWQHKVARRLADENQAVVVENLAVKHMLQSRHLARAIGEAGWSGFVVKVPYKLERNGRRLITIDRWFASSKQCSRCGRVAEKCPSCGTLHDRDVNAAQNVMRQGIVKLKAEGLSVSAGGGTRKSYATVGCSQCSRKPSPSGGGAVTADSRI